MTDEDPLRRISDDYNGDVLDSLRHISGSVNRMQRLIEGEGSFSPGIIGSVTTNSKQLAALDTRVAVLERTLDRFRWTVLGAAGAGGVLGGSVVATVARIILGS